MTSDDLVERLRADALHHKQLACDCDCRPMDTVNWDHALNCLEAADEIERLRNQLAALPDDKRASEAGDSAEQPVHSPAEKEREGRAHAPAPPPGSLD